MLPRLARCALLLALLAGCATTSVVRVAPLETPFPVSASRTYVDPSGAAVPPNAIEELGRFAFERTVEAPVLRKTTTPIELEQELEKELRAVGGEAITGLSIVPLEYDEGSHRSMLAARSAGGMTLAAGLAFVYLSGGAAPKNTSLWTTGAILSVIGAAGVIFSFSDASEPTRWRLRVTGTVVRYREPVPEGQEPGRRPGSRRPIRPD